MQMEMNSAQNILGIVADDIFADSNLVCCKTWLTSVEIEAAIFPSWYNLGHHDKVHFVFGFIIFHIRVNTAVH